MSPNDGSQPVASMARLVDERAIVVCCGSGGVGKTTTAAVLSAEAARRGRRAVVVTIDPAKRLADALGLAGGLTNDPALVEGPWPGELWAMMLDTKSTFDDLVHRHAPSPGQAERILANPFYRNISAALSGTQEYMAGEKLYELSEDPRFDLVVVDTPPTRNALDFLDAPGRLTRFLDHRLYRVLTAPTRLGLRVANFAAQAFLRTISKVVGGDVVSDAVAFFQAFEGMEAGFRARAAEVDRLLRAPATAYLLVAAPRRDAIREAEFFLGHLELLGMTPAGLVVNRVHPEQEVAGPPGAGGDALAPWWRNLDELAALAAAERRTLAPLTDRVMDAPVVLVPLLPTDVHDLDGLAQVATHLFA